MSQALKVMTRSRAARDTLPIGATLQVNLLPAEVRSARGVRSLKRILGLIVLGFVALLVLLAFVVQARVGAAEESLADEQARTGRLIAEQASYREVTVVTERLFLTQVAHLFAARDDVAWADYLGYVSATVPDGVTISTLTVSAASPLAGAPESLDPLVADGLGTLTLTAVSPTIPDATAWSRRLADVPGLVDPRVSTMVIDDETDEALYATVVTVRLSDGARTDRTTEIVGE